VGVAEEEESGEDYARPTNFGRNRLEFFQKYTASRQLGNVFVGSQPHLASLRHSNPFLISFKYVVFSKQLLWFLLAEGVGLGHA